LKAERLKDVSDWLSNYRQFWEARFDRLDDYLRQLQDEEHSHDDQEATT
jgi:hypothetical protein